MNELTATARLVLAFAVLALTAVILAKVSERTRVPIMLVFLAVGALAGSEGIGRLAFADYRLSFRVGTLALVLILFDGGLNTPLAALRPFAAPAAVLASAGVVGTAALTGVVGHVLGLDWSHAFLLGAVVSSTDAAAVFSVLRGSGIQLKRRIGVTLEAESGFNDAVAVLMTTVLSEQLLHPGSLLGSSIAGDIALEFGLGAAIGLAAGYGGGWLINRLRLPASGLYPVLTLALACLAFGGATVAHGSGFLAVYVAALALAAGPMPYRASVLRVHDALAWLSQVSMFLLLGVLAFPSHVMAVAPVGLALAVGLAFVARPAVVALCLAPFRYPAREIAYIGWVGLRGAVPIVLAIIPLLEGVFEAHYLFNVVFFVVVVNAVIPGSTVAWVTRRFGLESQMPPRPPATLEIDSRESMGGELLSFYIDEALGVTGVPISDLPLPPDASMLVVMRGGALLAPKGPTILETGDYVYILAPSDSRPVVELLFGRPTGD